MKAKRMFDAEKTILLLSSNLAFDNVWEKPYSCNIKKIYGRRRSITYRI